MHAFKQPGSSFHTHLHRIPTPTLPGVRVIAHGRHRHFENPLPLNHRTTFRDTATKSSRDDDIVNSAGAKKKTVFTREYITNKLSLVALFSVWYISNIYFNINNKQVLVQFGHPITCTFIHLAVSCAMSAFLWLTTIQKRPQLTPRVVDLIFPLAILHLIGFWTTNASLGAVAVSLTHTIKALEPFFTVTLSWLLLGARPAIPVMLSLLPIVGGVVIASVTDVSFNWFGFTAAMLSNVAFQTRNVLSKKAMLRTSFESLETGGGSDMSLLDEVNIFSLISFGALFLMIPFVLFFEVPSLMTLAANNGGGNILSCMSPDMWSLTITAGVCRFGDVLASFLILQRVIPVTHSVGNCVKRVVVIAASIAFFKTPASLTNIVGTGVALGGVLLYSMVKRMQKEVVDTEKTLELTPIESAFLAVSPGTIYRKVQKTMGVKPKTVKPKYDPDSDYSI